MNAWHEKAKLLFLGALLAVMVQLMLRDPPATTKPNPCAPTAFVAGSPAPVPSRTSPAGQDPPRLLLNAMGRLQRVPPAGSRDLFSYVSFHNPPPASLPRPATNPITDFSSAVKAIETPLEARRPLFYYGYTFRRGSALVAFLLFEDEIYLARRGDVIRGRYLIAELGRTWLVLEDRVSGDRRQIPLEGPA